MHLAKGHSEPAIEAVKEQEMAKLHAVIDCAFVSKTLRSLTRGIPTVSGENLDERLVTRTTRLPQATTYDFDELLDSIIPRSLLGSETAEMVIQPTTVQPSGSFHVSLRTGIYFNISDTMDQPDSSTGYPRWQFCVQDMLWTIVYDRNEEEKLNARIGSFCTVESCMNVWQGRYRPGNAIHTLYDQI